jgi:hypothetical protein
MNAIVLQDLLERCETPERRMRVVLRAAAGVDPAVLREFDGRWLELVTTGHMRVFDETGAPMVAQATERFESRADGSLAQVYEVS